MLAADEQFEQAIDGARSALQVDLLTLAEGFAKLPCGANQLQRRIGLHLHRLLRLGQDGVRDLLLGGSSFRFDGRIDSGVDRVHGTSRKLEVLLANIGRQEPAAASHFPILDSNVSSPPLQPAPAVQPAGEPSIRLLNRMG
jgi:hypothetical protein